MMHSRFVVASRRMWRSRRSAHAHGAMLGVDKPMLKPNVALAYRCASCYSRTRWPSTGPQRYERGACACKIKHDRARVEPCVFSGGGRPGTIVIDCCAAEPDAGGGIERRPRDPPDFAVRKSPARLDPRRNRAGILVDHDETQRAVVGTRSPAACANISMP